MGQICKLVMKHHGFSIQQDEAVTSPGMLPLFEDSTNLVELITSSLGPQASEAALSDERFNDLALLAVKFQNKEAN
jgi:hypothetical protein